MKDKDFDFTCLPEETRDPEIKKEDFVLQQADSTIHEQKFQTKPTTFLKDSLKRFRKNKSSVVATYILGILVLLAIFVPIFNTNDVSNAADSALKNLEPKLFDGGGFWDGTLTVKHKEVDPYNNYYPDPDLYLPGGVKNITVEGADFTSTPNKFGQGGYLQSGFYGGMGTEEAILSPTSSADFVNSDDKFTFLLDLEHTTLTLDQFLVADEAMLRSDLGNDGVVPENYTLGLTSLDFVYEYNSEEKTIEIVAPAVAHTIGIDGGEPTINLSEYILARSEGVTKFSDFRFVFRTTKTDTTTPDDHVCSLIKSFVISTSSTTLGEKLYFSKDVDDTYKTHGICFDDAMQIMVVDEEVKVTIKEQEGAPAKRYTIINPGYWMSGASTKFIKRIHLARAYFASFTYDSYQATLGEITYTLDNYKMQEYEDAGYIDFDIDIRKIGNKYQILSYHCEILEPELCPMTEVPAKEDFYDLEELYGEKIFKVDAKVIYYKYLGYKTMPKYLFGTDKTGRDMFKYVFEGLRNSLLLGVITFVVCFTFGLIWGAICGYFGGAVDLVMERFTDILSGIPWIVVMTLVVLKAGSSIGTFAFALCLTGWIGTAATTRTQFYRFRGREYVLASRTLGASDARLIAKHILPNAMGTIITGAVLMIPSVIFSEATISYLGLGFRDLSSLGVILSSNQSELTNHPYQLIFPSVIIALVMISFNLFGNGLRDAINPSLKGEGE